MDKNILFISYSRKDTEFVEKLECDLQTRGVITWRDENDIKEGERWRAKIERAIKSCTAMLYIDTPHAEVSEWAEEELLYARNIGKLVIPVRPDAQFSSFGVGSLNPVVFDKENYTKGINKIIIRFRTYAESPIPIDFEDDNKNNSDDEQSWDISLDDVKRVNKDLFALLMGTISDKNETFLDLLESARQFWQTYCELLPENEDELSINLQETYIREYAQLCYSLGMNVAREEGDLEKAHKYFEMGIEALSKYELLGEHYLYGRLLFGLGNVLMFKGEYQKALKYWEAIPDVTENLIIIEKALMNAGSTQASMGEFESALQTYQKLETKVATLLNGDAQADKEILFSIWSRVLQNLGILETQLCRFYVARKHLLKAQTLAEILRISNVELDIEILQALGDLEIYTHRYDESDAYLRQAYTYFETRDDGSSPFVHPMYRAQIRVTQARLEIARAETSDDLEKAEVYLDEVDKITEQMPIPPLIAYSALYRGHYHLKRKAFDKAMETYEQVINIQQVSPELHGLAFCGQAETHIHLGECDEAKVKLEQDKQFLDNYPYLKQEIERVHRLLEAK